MDQLLEFVSTPGGLAIAGVLGGVVGWLFVSVDNRVEDRRRKAIEIAGKLRGAGFTRLPVFFEDYAVQDYSGMLRALKDLHDVLSDDAQRRQELERVLRLLLTDLFRDPEKRPALLKLIDDLKAANLPDARSVVSDAIGQVFSQKSILHELLPDADSRLKSVVGRLMGRSDAAEPAAPGPGPEPAHVS